MVEQLTMLGEEETAAAPSKTQLDAMGIWNEFAKQYKWKEARVLDSARRASLRRAVKDYGGLTGFRSALATVAKNRFVQGMIPPKDGFKQFVANLDWFMRPATVRKVLEDFYEDQGADGSRASSGPVSQETVDDKWRRWLKGYRPGRFWPSSQGPRPEDPSCTGPAELLEWWRTQHSVKRVERVIETREERLRSSITSYRNVGKYDRANALEEDLARLEKRPAVLVPSPDTAHMTGAASDRRNEKRTPPVVFDIPPDSPADKERDRRMEFERVNEPPPPDDVIESEFAEGYEE